MAMAKQPPSSGQSAAIAQFGADGLTDKERVVVRVLATDVSHTIEALSIQCWPDKPPGQANSWVRNALRRLVPGGWAEKVQPGLYAATNKAKVEIAFGRV